MVETTRWPLFLGAPLGSSRGPPEAATIAAAVTEEVAAAADVAEEAGAAAGVCIEGCCCF